MAQAIDTFLGTFIEKAPTAWHACEFISQRLKECGFVELNERDAWSIESGKKYFIIRNGSSCIAFVTPKNTPQKSIILAAHTDSPGLKLKQQGEFKKDGMVFLQCEVYGSPILASWVGQELFLAGRVYYNNEKGALQSALVEFPEHVCISPLLAIHLDRQVNDTGLQIQKNEHLALLAADASLIPENATYLETLCKSKIGNSSSLLYVELFAVPHARPASIGLNNEWLASYRLDNLSSCSAIIEAFEEVTEPQEDVLQYMVLWNHEEVGSETHEGAMSSFFADAFERVSFHLGLDIEERLKLKANSFAISCDAAHGFHPSFPEKYDTRHRAYLGKGIALKMNSQERYAVNAELVAKLIEICKKENISYQYFCSKNDIPCGSTIGPIHAAKLGMATVDLGLPLLSMHATKEIIAYKDYTALKRLFSKILTSKALYCTQDS